MNIGMTGPTPSNVYDTKSTKLPSKHSKWSRLAHFGQDYADESSIDGVKYFSGTIAGHYSMRILWFIVFCVSVGFGLFIFHPIWLQYTQKATQNLIDYVEPDSFQFPSVSVRNLNFFRKSIIGRNYAPFLNFKTTYRFNSTTDGKLMCGSESLFERLPPDPIIQKYVVGAMQKAFKNITSLTSTYGYPGLIMLSTSTSMQSIQMCRFQGITLTDEECYSAFQNRITNNGYYFTFNPPAFTRNYSIANLHSGDNNYSPGRNADSTFPTPLREMIDFTVNSRGLANAVEFLLNTQQHEYCDAGTNGGAGFEMQIHPRNIQPVIYELMDNVIRLTPGTEVTVTIRESHTIRDTESAGWCTSKVDLKYYNHLTHYDKSACITECVTMWIKNQCKCLPEFAPSDAFVELVEARSKLNLTHIESLYYYPNQICTTDEKRKCAHDLTRSMIVNHAINTECEHCKTPCFERNYLIEKTENAFPARNAFHLYRDMKYARINYTALMKVTNSSTIREMHALDPRSYNLAEPFSSLEEMRENLIYLRIQLADMTVVVAKETFAVSGSQLLTQLGGAISLFVGASVLSLVECIYWIVVPETLRRNNYRSN